MDPVSKQTRMAFREHFVTWGTLRTIRDAFDVADIPRRDLPSTAVPVSGERRTLIEEYYAGIDWASPADSRKVLRAYEGALRELERRLEISGDAAVRQELEKLAGLLERDGFAYEGGQIVASAGIDLTTLEEASQVVDRQTLRDHIRRIEQSIDSDPAQAIGSAKELVETVAKHILAEHGKDPNAFDSVQQLVKEALKCLNLSTEQIPESTKGVAALRQVLSGLGQIVGGMAELRNLYGTGHGRTRTGGVDPRHARLVVGAAATLARFLLETLDARKNQQS